MRSLWCSRWLHFGLWLGLIFGLSSIPDLTPPGPSVSGLDKLFHAGEYAVLGALWGRALGLRRSGFWLGAALGLGVGILDELLQGRIPGRERDAFDVMADMVGAALGCASWVWFARRRQPAPERPIGSGPGERP